MKKTVLISVLLLIVFISNAQISKNVNVTTAGKLSDALTATEMTTVTNLTITGTIDARDFKTMNSSMTALKVIDLSGANIVAYSGIGGSCHFSTSSMSYPEDGLPYDAFYKCGNITSVIIPNSVTSIGEFAFEECYSLTSITIPNSVSSIGYGAFMDCQRLISINIPSSVTSLGNSDGSFVGCSAFMTVDNSNPNYSSLNGVLFNKDKTTLIHCPTSTTGSYSIPSSVTSIAYEAFTECRKLNSITIPNSVSYIGQGAFSACTGLTSIYSYSTTPVALTLSDVFSYIDKVNCILYVPIGCKALYQSANQWKDFTNILEWQPTGVNEMPKNDVTFYPNPCHSLLTINGVSVISNVSIFDINGKLIYIKQSSNNQIDISNLKQGIYIVKIDNNNKIVTGRLIKY